MHKILDSVEYVVNNSKHVKINKDAVKGFCKNYHESNNAHWVSKAPFNISKLSNKDKLHFLLVLDAMSFSYWGEPKWTIEYKGEKLDGAYGMIASIGRAVENQIPILDPNYLKNISEQELIKILNGNTIIPLFHERLKMLKEVGNVLVQKFKGNFENLVKESEGSAVKLLNLILNNFPSFNDSSEYKGKKIFFYKRAQLLVGDICQMFSNGEYGEFKELNEITACADYKLPLVLRKAGILEYSPELANKIDKKIEILKDSNEEIEIRANTIFANELIKEELKNTIPGITSINVNDALWLIGQVKSPNDKPYHLTRTISY